MSNEANPPVASDTPAAPAPQPASPPSRQERRILYFFTRTPLHVGAGASVGAIDQPIQRERHTGFPIIPGSTLKGVFADDWTEVVEKEKDDPQNPGKKIKVREAQPKLERDWLFGKGDGTDFAAGALQFGEARLLAFPVRSARGSFAWLICPLMLRRAARDGVLTLTEAQLVSLQVGLTDETASFTSSGPIAIGNQEVVLEEYALKLARAEAGTDAEKAQANADADAALICVGAELKQLLAKDLVWSEVATRLVVISDGMMSFFATSACEVAQHVTIDDATGTAKNTGLFNQENVPSETLLYAVLHAFPESGKQLKDDRNNPRQPRTAAQAVEQFWPDPALVRVFQFGADASTGLGYCTVKLDSPKP